MFLFFTRTKRLANIDCSPSAQICDNPTRNITQQCAIYQYLNLISIPRQTLLPPSCTSLLPHWPLIVWSVDIIQCCPSFIHILFSHAHLPIIVSDRPITSLDLIFKNCSLTVVPFLSTSLLLPTDKSNIPQALCPKPPFLRSLREFVKLESKWRLDELFDNISSLFPNK